MPLTLLKRVVGKWEDVRDFVFKDLQHIESYLNRLPESPDSLPPRSDSVFSSPTPSINTDLTDFFFINQLSEPIQSFTMNLQGEPVEGQRLTIRILDNGTPRVIQWGSSFRSSEATLPTTTTASSYLYIELAYNAITSTWDCLSVGDGVQPLLVSHHITHETGGSDAITSIAGTIITSGTVDPNRLGSGASSSTFLRGDSTFTSPIPSGVILGYGAVVAPSGWQLCDGSAISRTTFSTLFGVISTTYGVGDGSTTFNVPDLRQRFPLGKAAAGTGSTLGSSGGTIDHTHTSTAHTHSIPGLSVPSLSVPSLSVGTTSATTTTESNNHAHGGVTAGGDLSGGADTAHTHDYTTPTGSTSTGTTGTGTTGTGTSGSTTPGVTGSNNPPFLVLNFIIKA